MVVNPYITTDADKMICNLKGHTWARLFIEGRPACSVCKRPLCKALDCMDLAGVDLRCKGHEPPQRLRLVKTDGARA